MGHNAEYLIPFKGLENGIHNYRFQVSTDFFEQFENSRIQEGEFKVDLVFDKRDQMMILDLFFDGNYSASCDRCLAAISIPNQGDDRIIVKKYSDHSSNDNEEVLLINDDDHELNIAPIIYDMIHLHLPLINRRDCESDGYKYCNHAVLDKIENSDDEEDNDDNGNWDILKDLNLD